MPTTEKKQLNINVADEELVLDGRKAVFWPRTNALLLTDLHLGKVQHFRKAGISIPGQSVESNWQRLDSLMKSYQPDQLILLGDLFHSQHNTAWDRWAEWAESYDSMRIILIRGNHDILTDERYRSIPNLSIYRSKRLFPFFLSHRPEDKGTADTYQLSGHWHPGIRLRGRGKQQLKLPCFYFAKNYAVLPAFGTFTGLRVLQAEKNSRVFAIGESRVFHCN